MLEDMKAINWGSLDEEIPKKDSKLAKALLLSLGLITIILMVTYIFSVFPLADIIKSRLESELLEDDRLELAEFSIYFEEGTAEWLESMYFQEQKNEFSVCLLGSQREGNYYINSLYRPEQRQSFNQVVFAPCSPVALIILHTHPYKRCAASETDLRTLNKTKERNPEVLMVVMCEVKRFSVYG